MNKNIVKGYKLLVKTCWDCERRHWNDSVAGYFHTEEAAKEYCTTFENEKKKEEYYYMRYLEDRNNDNHFYFTIKPFEIEFLD